MKTTVITHQANLNLWSGRIAEQKASGLLVDEWCSQNGVSRNQFYYWKRQLKEACLDSMLPDIVPITVPVTSQTPDNTSCTTHTTCTTNSAIRITLPGIYLEVDNSFPTDMLLDIIKAVRHA